jgi:hypothetical protein
LLRKIYIALSPLPLLAFLGILYWMSTLEGWGALGVVPLLRRTIIFSAALGVVGVALMVRARLRRQKILGLLLATLLAGSAALVIAALMLLRELERSF